MCGLVGTIDWQRNGYCNNSNIEDALRIIRPRGPDATGIWSDDYVGLGHLRLAVIDLTENAAQPMRSHCDRYVIVFNGEIYNFADIRSQINCAWKSESDTEVVLAAYIKWGPLCLDKFHGMFAFAIWDRSEKTLFVARDRMGVKPLYYHATNELFAFASRPRALFELLPHLSSAWDRQALRYYLEAGYIPAPHSCHRDIKKLEPGHYLMIREKGIKKERYWSLNSISTDASLELASEKELIDELDVIIERSVRWRMVSNVPIGAFLSGGIDSSLVAAYMKKHASGPVKTFTIGFDDGEFDESRHASAVARYLGTDHTCQYLSPNDLLALMPVYMEEYDEPFFDYSAFPVMAVSRLARQHVTVSLSGDGGDEGFGGYHYYRIAQILGILQSCPKFFRNSMAALVSRLPSHKFRMLGRALNAESNAATFAFIRSVIKDFDSIMTPEFKADTQPLASLFQDRASTFPRNLTPAEMGMRLDLAFTLPDDYLQKVDVGSMAFSLEAREPLLDHSILEWAAKLPLKWKMRGGVNKYLLRQLAYRYVPKEILDRPKMGFGVPMARWLRGELRPWAEDLLADFAAIDDLGLDRRAIVALWRAHLTGIREAQSCLWTVLVLLQFYRNFTAKNENRY